jgi:zinc protease
LRREDLLTFFSKCYVAKNTTIVVVGDFDADKARQQIAKAFGSMPAGEVIGTRPHQSAQSQLRVTATARDVKETQLLLGFRTPAINHADVPALDLLAVALGQGDSSRLNLEVVRNRQLVTTSSSYLFSARDPGLMVVAASLPPGRVDDAAKALLDEILRLSREEMAQEELAKARTILESDRVYDKETVQGHARKLGFFAAIAGDANFEERYLSSLQKLTPADLRRVAAQYLRISNLTVFAQVPEAKAEKQQQRAEKAIARISRLAEAAEARADARFARAAASNESDRVVTHVFPSGLKLLVMRDASVPIAAVRATWVGGLRYEDARNNGISNMLAALLSRGTKTRSAEQIMHEVEGMAGSISGYSGRNSLGLQAEFLSRHLERGFDLVADCLLNATFSEEELDKERRIILDDLRAQEDNLGQVAFRLFHSGMWRRHPYRMDPLGTADSVSGLTRRKLIHHFRRYYSIKNLTLAVVGDVDPNRVIAKVGVLFGGVAESGTEQPVVAIDPPLASPNQLYKFLAKEQAHVILGFPGVTFSNSDRYPLEILAHVLSGQGGRLFSEIREKRALAYRVSAFSLEGIDPGYFAVYVATSPEKTDEAIRSIRQELASVVEKGITAEELSRAQRYLIGVHAIGLQRKSALAAALAFYEAYGQGWRAYRLFGDHIMKVTVADVTRMARKYLDPQRELVVFVQPGAQTPGAARASARAGTRQGSKPGRSQESLTGRPGQDPDVTSNLR